MVGIRGKSQGKCKICDIFIIEIENVFQWTFLSKIAQGKVSKCPGNLRENSGNLVSRNWCHFGILW